LRRLERRPEALRGYAAQDFPVDIGIRERQSFKFRRQLSMATLKLFTSGSDPARGIIDSRAPRLARESQCVMPAAQRCSEKVNNLRVAIEQLPPEFEALAFTIPMSDPENPGCITS